MGQVQGQAQNGCWVVTAHIIAAIPFAPGQGHSGPLASLLTAALQKTRCPGAFPIVPAWSGIHLCPSFPSLGVARLPSNLFTHIPLKTDSGPSKQLPSPAVEVSLHLRMQVMWMGTFTGFEFLPRGRQPPTQKPGTSGRQLCPWPLQARILHPYQAEFISVSGFWGTPEPLHMFFYVSRMLLPSSATCEARSNS